MWVITAFSLITTKAATLCSVIFVRVCQYRDVWSSGGSRHLRTRRPPPPLLGFCYKYKSAMYRYCFQWMLWSSESFSFRGLLWPLTPWTELGSAPLPLNPAGGSSRADWVDMLSSACSRCAFYRYNGSLSPFLLLQYENKETAVS